MAERHSVTHLLTRHFFRRFFDSDTVQIEGEALTTVVRAIAIVAAPGLITAFFLQNSYPGRSPWGAIEDQYFFVLLSFVVMGAVATFEWEMLFPDRSDFLILTPLPLKPLAQVQANDPGEFVQVALALQFEVPLVHSLISVQVTPLPL